MEKLGRLQAQQRMQMDGPSISGLDDHWNDSGLGTGLLGGEGSHCGRSSGVFLRGQFKYEYGVVVLLQE